MNILSHFNALIEKSFQKFLHHYFDKTLYLSKSSSFGNYYDFIHDLDQFSTNFTKDIFISYIEFIDDCFFHSSYRKNYCTSKGFYERKNYVTLFGDISFKRRYYFDKFKGAALALLRQRDNDCCADKAGLIIRYSRRYEKLFFRLRFRRGGQAKVFAVEAVPCQPFEVQRAGQRGFEPYKRFALLQAYVRALSELLRARGKARGQYHGTAFEAERVACVH